MTYIGRIRQIRMARAADASSAARTDRLSIVELEARAVQLIGSRERRLFLMDDNGTYWVRDDMTSEEGDVVADTLASWLYYAISGAKPGDWAARRLYDDGDVIPR